MQRKTAVSYLFPFFEELQRCVALHRRFEFDTCYETQQIERLNSVFEAERASLNESVSQLEMGLQITRLAVPTRSRDFTLTHAQRASALHISGIADMVDELAPPRSYLSAKMDPEWFKELTGVFQKPSPEFVAMRKIANLRVTRSSPTRPALQILVSPTGTGKRTIAASSVVGLLCSANWHTFWLDARCRREMSADMDGSNEKTRLARVAVVFAPYPHGEDWEQTFKGLLGTPDCSRETGSFAVNEGSGWTLARVGGVKQVAAAFDAYRITGGAHILIVDSSFGAPTPIAVSKQLDFPSVFVYAAGTGAAAAISAEARPPLSLFLASSFRELSLDIQRHDRHPLRKMLGIGRESSVRDLEFACSVTNGVSTGTATQVDTALQRQLSLRLATGPLGLALMRLADAIPLMPRASRCFELQFDGSKRKLVPKENIFVDFVEHARHKFEAIQTYCSWVGDKESKEAFEEVLKSPSELLHRSFETSFGGGLALVRELCNSLLDAIGNFRVQEGTVVNFIGATGLPNLLRKAVELVESAGSVRCMVCFGPLVDQDILGLSHAPESAGLTGCCAHPLCDHCYKLIKLESRISCPACRCDTEEFCFVGVLPKQQHPPSDRICDKYLPSIRVPDDESGDGIFDRFCAAISKKPCCLDRTVDLAVAAALRSCPTQHPRIIVLSEASASISVVDHSKIDYASPTCLPNSLAADTATNESFARFSSLPGPRVLFVYTSNRIKLLKTLSCATAVVAVEPGEWFAQSLADLMSVGSARNRPVLRVFRVLKA